MAKDSTAAATERAEQAERAPDQRQPYERPTVTRDDGRARLAEAEQARWQEMALDVEGSVRQLLALPWIRRRLERGQPVTRVQLRLIFASPEDAVEADVSLERG